jgi:PleD family two-component response regulator
MAGSVVDAGLVVAKRKRLGTVEDIDRRRLPDLESEQRTLLNGHVVQELVVAVQVDGNVERLFRSGDTGDVVDVGVRQQDGLDLDVEIANRAEQLVDLIARVDEDGLTRSFARHDKAVLVERCDGSDFKNHGSRPVRLKPDATRALAGHYNDHSMIVCAIDDLLFSIRIRNAAKTLQADIYFERSGEKLLDTIREKRPSLVIFDLNSQRLRPLEAIAALKGDPELLAIRTVGYVSHVDTGTIDAARAAGIDQVLARSAFVAQLGDILTTA